MMMGNTGYGRVGRRRVVAVCSLLLAVFAAGVAVAVAAAVFVAARVEVVVVAAIAPVTCGMVAVL